VVDVRDVAAAHTAVLEPGRGPRRYLLAAADLAYRDILEKLRQITGRRLPAVRVPGRPVAASLLPLEAVQRVVPFRLPLDFGAPWVLAHGGLTDGSAAVRELDVTYRPVDESIGDVVRWLHEAGHVDEHRAGRVARHAVPA
jgi:dihydroflavonol-4-reductase